MIEWNFYAWAILASVGGLYLLPYITDFLIDRFSRWSPPEGWESLLDEESSEKQAQYVELGTRLDFAQRTTFAMAFLAIWLGGGFTWLAEQTLEWTDDPAKASCLCSLAVLSMVYAVWLTFRSLYVFWLEARFGFNKTSVRTFVLDQIKLLGLVVCIWGIGAAFVSIGRSWTNTTSSSPFTILELGLPWWGNVLLACVALVITLYFFPWILRLFLRIRRLDDGDLRQRIASLADRCGFPHAQVYVVDGSRRSSRPNGFFTGIGRRKMVGLFDTLVQDYTPEQIEAVVAHEIGHCKLGHIRQRILFLIVPYMAASVWLLELTRHNQDLAEALGVPQLPEFASLLGICVFYGVLFRVFYTALCTLSRRQEYEADEYAAAAVRSPKPLVDALRQLTQQNLGNPTPHPWIVCLYYTHPPLSDRIQALENGTRPGKRRTETCSATLPWNTMAGESVG